MLPRLRYDSLTTRMAQQNRDFAAFASIAIAGALTFLALGRPMSSAVSPLDAVPEPSFMVISVDVATLRGSPIFTSVFGKDRVEAVTKACGFDPLTRIDELDVAVPEGGDTGDFGIAANGAMQTAELVACAEKILAARGGHPTITTAGTPLRGSAERSTFSRVEGEANGPRLAFREGGPFLVGRGSWLDTMMETAEGRRPSVRANATHAALRDSLEAHTKKSVVLASAILPKDLRDRLKNLKKEMGTESPTESAGIMSGVLGVSAAGLAIRVVGSPVEPTLEAELQLRCETAGACAEVERFIAKKRLSWSKDFGMRLVGLGPLIDELKVKSEGSSLIASTRARLDDVSAAIERVMKMNGRSAPGSGGQDSGADRRQIPAKDPVVPPPPDEILKPHGAPHRDALPDASISEGGR